VCNSWDAHTSWSEVCRRASGRRHYNGWRRFIALRRRIQVAELCCKLSGQLKGILGRYGIQSAIARILNVNRSTVCRDMQAIERDWQERETRKRRLCERILSGDYKKNPLTREERREAAEIIREMGEREIIEKKYGFPIF
jgi:hypothetical protein